MAGKTKPGSALKGINIKLKMINDLMDVTGSAKDSWNPAEISDDMKAIAYIHRLADTWNPAQLNEALKYLGFATIDSWNPAIIEETKNKLVKHFLPTEATGNPITFNTYGNLPYEVSKVEVTFLPKQSGSGEPSPNNVRPISGWTEVNLERTGKNLFDTSGEWTRTGVVISDNTVSMPVLGSGGTCYYNTNPIDVRGEITFSAQTNGTYSRLFIRLRNKENTDWLSGEDTSISGWTYNQYYGGWWKEFTSKTLTVSFVIPDCGYFNFGLGCNSNTDVGVGNNFTFTNPQLEVGNSATEFEPFKSKQTYTESLGATYYGGKADFVSGEGLEEWDYIASYDGETLPGEWISDRDVYAPGTTPTTGAEVAYKLSEAVELTLTPQEIELLKGQNVIWTDGDNIVIEYKALLNS